MSNSCYVVLEVLTVNQKAFLTKYDEALCISEIVENLKALK